MSGRAQRMAEATHLPMLDRRAQTRPGDALVAGDVRIPRAGTADVVVDGRRVRLTHLDRILWPATGFTKAELIAYYLTIAPVLLPHLRDRPLTLGRFPGGVDGRGFAQSDVPGRPPWLRAVRLPLVKGDVRDFALAEERAALVWLAQMGTLELHTFLGVLPDLEHPTAVLFDLDPATPDGLLDAAAVALRLRVRCRQLGLPTRVKTSGSIGVHVLVPTRGAATFAETRAFAEAMARELAAATPDAVTAGMARAARGGRVLVDVRQNARRLTMVVPYSLRAAPRPTVSTPVRWREVERAVATGDASRLTFAAGDVLARVARLGDVFRDQD